MRRAFVSTFFVPKPHRDSGSKRLFDMMRAMRKQGWDVTFVPTRGIDDEIDARRLRRIGVTVYDTEQIDVETLAATGSFDVALFAFWQIAEQMTPLFRVRSPHTRVVIDSVDAQFVRDARRALRIGPSGGPTELLGSDYGDTMVGELNAYATADCVLAVSEVEAELIGSLVNDRSLVHSVPDSERAEAGSASFDQRAGMLFVGGFKHLPNADAVLYACEEILPLVPEELRRRHPFYVVGDSLDDRIRAYADGVDHVRMVGWVPSLTPYYERARIVLAPLRYGAGTKRKVIQALTANVPIVTSSIGAEGLHLESERDVLLADDPQSFADAIERLLQDRPLWEQLANSTPHILERHSEEAAAEALFTALEAALARDPKPAAPTGPSRPPSGRKRQSGRLAPVSAKGDGRDVAGGEIEDIQSALKVIAFYLPQFHPIPENDVWWGEGFTEWRNVTKARPFFDGHYQPRLPSNLGFYDLRLPETREAQAQLARSYGITGFCYYHYWFSGKQLLERPFDEVLATGSPDFPFCLCWANEPWSRRWDGEEHHVLQPQNYSEEDDHEHISWLLPALLDKRAIRVDDKPLFLVYQGHKLPDPTRTIEIWQAAARDHGLRGLHLVSVETGWDEGWDATEVGFDAKVGFQPQFTVLDTVPKLDLGPETMRVFDYPEAWKVLADLKPVDYLRYECVCPSWDNTARRGADSWLLHNSTPEAYQEWLELAIRRTLERPPSQRLVFLNAWNEWAEGAHLEPDQQHGLEYLEATKRALERTSADGQATLPKALT